MKTTFASLLSASLLLFSPSISAAPYNKDFRPDHHPTQPGYGPHPRPNPVGLWGLQRNGRAYHHLCEESPTPYSSPRACFDTQVYLEKVLSAPNPDHLKGYIDGSGTNFVLYPGQIVTIANTYEIHVDKPNSAKQDARGCAKVLIYQLPQWKKQIHEVWCPGEDEPIKL